MTGDHGELSRIFAPGSRRRRRFLCMHELHAWAANFPFVDRTPNADDQLVARPDRQTASDNWQGADRADPYINRYPQSTPVRPFGSRSVVVGRARIRSLVQFGSPRRERTLATMATLCQPLATRPEQGSGRRNLKVRSRSPTGQLPAHRVHTSRCCIKASRSCGPADPLRTMRP